MLQNEVVNLSVKDACREPNPAVRAMEKLQKEMKNESARMGFTTEVDVVRMIKELRSENNQ